MVMKKTFDKWMEEAQGLRREAHAAETRLLLFLVDFEKSGAWRDGGFNTFATLLRQYKLTRSERFEEFKSARGKIDDDVIVTIGASATLQANKIGDRKTRDDYIREAELRVASDGFPWSEDQAERARIRVSPDPPKLLMRVARENRVERDLAEAREVIETLRAENESLRGEIKELKRRAVSTKKAISKEVSGRLRESRPA